MYICIQQAVRSLQVKDGERPYAPGRDGVVHLSVNA